MGGRFAAAAILGLLITAAPAHAEDFSLVHKHSGVTDASAQGSVTFPDAGGATIAVTITDRDPDGWCAKAWVTSNLPPATHKTYQVCGAAEQQTYNLPLPASARCDVTFVEVQVGRIDPSEGNIIELGESKRMANPCPPLPQPLPAPPPPPPPPPPAKVEARVDHVWYATHNWTRNTKLMVRDVPAGGSVELRCHGRGCPTKRRSVAVRKGRADLHRLLRSHHLRVGATLEVRVAAVGMVGKVVRFKVRRGRIPSMQRLCLPPGARSPQRC